jgi:two-component system NtrC family sensor kinase
MPGLSGQEVHQWLSSARPELLHRLVFASGDTASPETAAFLNSIPCPVLEKPFELAELAAVVSRVCGDERAGVA